MNRTWLEKEEQFLIDNYFNLGSQLCAKALNKTPAAIRNKAYKLRIKTNPLGSWITDQEYKLRLANSEYSSLEPYQLSNKKILHRHNPCGYEWKVSPNNLAKIVSCPKCYRKAYSKMAIKWLETISPNILHAENGGEQIIANYRVDGYDPETNTAYEFHGDVFHGNLDRFNPDDTPHPYNNLTAEELWEATFYKMETISKVCKLVYIWESDYLKGNSSNEF